MSDTGWVSPGTVVNDSSVGNIAWNNPTYAMSEDGNDSQAYLYSGNADVKEMYIRIVKGGSIGSTEKSTNAILTTSYPGIYVAYGGSTDLWGETWAASDINSSTFGVVYSCFVELTNYSQYLKATNFSFNIPTGATINGIEAQIKQRNFNSFGVGGSVDHIQIKVYYTESGTPTVGVKYPLPPFKRP